MQQMFVVLSKSYRKFNENLEKITQTHMLIMLQRTWDGYFSFTCHGFNLYTIAGTLVILGGLGVGSYIHASHLLYSNNPSLTCTINFGFGMKQIYFNGLL
jgi:hypothetical protein